jgi:hypothetical protein
MLDFSPLAKALLTLASAMAETDTRPGDLLARDGCIQRFEYSYELCVKSIRRQLEEMSAYNPEKAAQVYVGIPVFLRHAKELAARLLP